MSLRTLQYCILHPELVPYSAGLKLQDILVAQRKAEQVPDTLLLLQHHPVYTIGKRGKLSDFKVSLEELQAAGVEVAVSQRGGEVTFHGPGQIVAYPIVHLRHAGRGPRRYVEGLEDSLIAMLATYGIRGQGRLPGRTGVWVGERKIAALGVRITHSVSSHGLALNVNPDLAHFSKIVPCGQAGRAVTSIQAELPPGQPEPTWGEACQRLLHALCHEFEYDRAQQVMVEELTAGTCV